MIGNRKKTRNKHGIKTKQTKRAKMLIMKYGNMWNMIGNRKYKKQRKKNKQTSKNKKIKRTKPKSKQTKT